MVKSMNDIGHSLGLRTVAEYVESSMLLEALREIGVDVIHKPCRLDELMGQKKRRVLAAFFFAAIELTSSRHAVLWCARPWIFPEFSLSRIMPPAIMETTDGRSD